MLRRKSLKGLHVSLMQLLHCGEAAVGIARDRNAGGDGARIRITAAPDGFRLLAQVFQQIADVVDDAEHPAHDAEWHIGQKSGEVPAISLTNAAVLNLNWVPARSERPAD